MWKYLATRAQNEGNLWGAVHFLSKAIRSDTSDAGSRWEKAQLLEKLNHPKKAAKELVNLRKSHPGELEVALMLARLYSDLEQTELAVKVLEEQIEHYPAESNLTLVNILTQLYMADGAFAQALRLIGQAQTSPCPDGTPIDLTVKAAICHLYLGENQEAEELLGVLLDSGVDENPDLFHDVADTYWALGRASEAYRFLDPLQTHPDHDQPALWAYLASCQCSLENHDAAVGVYMEVLRRHPDHLEAQVALAELFFERGGAHLMDSHAAGLCDGLRALQA
ncbi:hypothetical protein CYMTET_53332, partial [Cymbomonas tetramitiformis]